MEPRPFALRAEVPVPVRAYTLAVPKPYEHQEYPKWVTPPGGAAVIVNSAEEEAALLPASRARRAKEA